MFWLSIMHFQKKLRDRFTLLLFILRFILLSFFEESATTLIQCNLISRHRDDDVIKIFNRIQQQKYGVYLKFDLHRKCYRMTCVLRRFDDFHFFLTVVTNVIIMTSSYCSQKWVSVVFKTLPCFHAFITLDQIF